jgi:lupus La protein
MRRYNEGEKDKIFKGSIFVEFKTLESLNKVLEMSELKYNDEVLVVETKNNYFERKSSESKQEKKSKNSSNNTSTDTAGTTQSSDKTTTKIRQSGAVLHFNGCGDDTSREDIKEYFRQFASVAWIDFQRGNKEGYVRFEEEDAAKIAMEGVMKHVPEGGKTQLCGGDSQMKVLEGDEEMVYWEKMAVDQDKRRKKKGWPKGGPQKGERESEGKEDEMIINRRKEMEKTSKRFIKGRTSHKSNKRRST